jgi:hypothetical protein
MFAVSPDVYKIYKQKPNAKAHSGCMAAACHLPWATAVGLSAVAHGG